MLKNNIATITNKPTQKETRMMACSFSPYCLGMCEWTDCPGHSNASGLQLEISPSHPLPQLEQLRPSASKDQPRLPMASNESSRFKFSSEEQLSELAKGLIPENTKGSTNWALKSFNLWLKSRNDANPENPVATQYSTVCKCLHVATF